MGKKSSGQIKQGEYSDVYEDLGYEISSLGNYADNINTYTIIEDNLDTINGSKGYNFLKQIIDNNYLDGNQLKKKKYEIFNIPEIKLSYLGLPCIKADNVIDDDEMLPINIYIIKNISHEIESYLDNILYKYDNPQSSTNK